MKKITLLLVMLHSVASFGQLRNFDKNGRKEKVEEEKITISVAAPSGPVAALPIAAIGGALISAGTGAAKMALEKREASFTATYAASYTGEPFYISNNMQIGDVTIVRETKVRGSAAFTTSAQIVLKPESSTLGSVFRFKVESISLNTSKARIKKHGKTGKAVDVSVTIQLTGIWNEYEYNKDDPKKAPKISIKSAVLGESTILLQNVKPGTPQNFAGQNNNNLFSEFFQKIPATPINPVTVQPEPTELNRGWYILKVTVKEANPCGMNSNKLTNYLTENSESITDLLKSFIPESK